MAQRRERPVFRTLPVTAPAAGAEWSFPNNRGAVLWIYALTQRLVTSAVVATRTPTVRVLSGLEIVHIFTTAQNQAASLDRRIAAYNGANHADSATGGNRLAWPVDGVRLLNGWTVASNTPGMDVGDQYSEILIHCVEFPETLADRLIPFPVIYPDSDLE